MKNFFSIVLILFVSAAFGQQIHLFRTIYYPAEPYGGLKEMEEFIKQEMVYPDSALKQNIEGDVFITFLIDPRGRVKYKKVEDSGHPYLKQEAERIFDKIVWEADPNRDEDDLGYEKLKISFDSKKYKKVARRRGYHHLPYDSSLSHSESERIYQKSKVDEIPKIANANSVNQLVSENFKFPSIAKERGISGRVTVEFVVEKYGLSSNVRVLEPLAGGCNEETIRLVKMMRWRPAIKDGETVRCFYTYSLNFMKSAGTIR